MRLLSLTVALSLLAVPAFAAEETTALLSPKCDAAKLKTLGDTAVTKVAPGAAKDMYNITFDNGKISGSDLAKKAIDAGCMKFD